jgi:hypothetical protein
MDPLGIALIFLLGAIGLIHLAWALGLYWPGTDGVSRAAYVVGTQGRELLGFWSWASIAFAFFCAIAVVWVAHQPITHPLHALIAYGGYLTLILVFALRGLAPYCTDVFGYARSTPFYRLNRRYYAPICLLLAAGLIADFPPGWEHFVLPADVFY